MKMMSLLPGLLQQRVQALSALPWIFTSHSWTHSTSQPFFAVLPLQFAFDLTQNLLPLKPNLKFFYNLENSYLALLMLLMRLLFLLYVLLLLLLLLLLPLLLMLLRTWIYIALLHATTSRCIMVNRCRTWHPSVVELLVGTAGRRLSCSTVNNSTERSLYQ